MSSKNRLINYKKVNRSFFLVLCTTSVMEAFRDRHSLDSKKTDTSQTYMSVIQYCLSVSLKKWKEMCEN